MFDVNSVVTAARRIGGTSDDWLGSRIGRLSTWTLRPGCFRMS